MMIVIGIQMTITENIKASVVATSYILSSNTTSHHYRSPSNTSML